MKYPWYEFLVAWTVSFIFGIFGFYLLLPYFPEGYQSFRIMFGLLFLKMAFDSSNETIKIKDEK